MSIVANQKIFGSLRTDQKCPLQHSPPGEGRTHLRAESTNMISWLMAIARDSSA